MGCAPDHKLNPTRHGSCWVASQGNGPCNGMIEHFTDITGTPRNDCAMLCEEHRKDKYYLGQIIAQGRWGAVPLSNISKQTLKDTLLTPAGPEPTCNPTLCRMHVGAGVSIDHEKDCAWVKWNEARRVPKSVGKPANAASPTGTKEFQIPEGYELHTYDITRLEQTSPNWRLWRVKAATGQHCPSKTIHGGARHDIAGPTGKTKTIRVCEPCQTIFTGCW